MADDTVDLIQFLQARKQQRQATNAQPEPLQSPLAPLTQQALTKTADLSQNRAPSAIVARGNLSWFERNQRKDELGRTIPIDTERGIELGEFGRMVWQRRPEERMTVLKKMFPNQAVRMSDTGEPLVELVGPGGTRSDVLVNPPGLNAQDFVEIGGSTPELAGGAAGAVLGGVGGASIAGPPGAFVGRILGGASGAAIGGGIKDAIARGAEGLPLNLSEIEKARAEEASLNALFDFGLSAGAKSLRILSPFATTKGPLQFNLEKARNYFEEVRGVPKSDLPVTPAELTGSTVLGKLEAFEAKQPGFDTIIGRIQRRGEETLGRLFNAAVGNRTPDEILYPDAVTTLRQQIAEPVELAVTNAREALVNKGESELVNIIDSLTPGAGSTSRKEAGESAREAFKQRKLDADAKVKADYATVRSLPGGAGKSLPTNPVVDAADDILNELPKVIEGKSKKAFDRYGNPIERIQVSEEVLKSGTPEGLMTFLKDMKRLKNQKMSLDELTKLKNSANDEIAKTEAVPGVKDRWFGKIASAYDQAVLQGADEVGKKQGNTALADALLKARETYKKELLPLDREGLHDILRTELEAGFQAPEQIVGRLFSGARAQHNYRALRETLGADSPAFRKVKRSLLDSWMMDASDELTQRVNPTNFETALKAFKSAQPDTYKDIIGSQEQQIFQITRSLKAAGKEIGDLDRDELAQLLRTGNVTKQNLERLSDAQKLRDTTFSNQIINDIKAGGDLDESPLKLARALHNTDIPESDVAEVLSKLSPTQVEALKTAELYRVLDKAGEFKSDYAPLFLEGVQNPVSAKGLMDAIGKAGSRERARTELLLGPDHEDLVKNAISLMAPRELKTTGTFRGAGSISGNTMVGQLLQKPLQYASSFARKFFTAVFYTSKAGQKLLINEAFNPKETAALANMLVASEPFILKLKEVVTEDSAFSIINELKSSIDRYVAQDTQPTEGQAQEAELMEFLRTRKGKVKIEAQP